MTTEAIPPMRSLEGRHVNVALRDGSRIDDCQLVSAHRPDAQTVWLSVDGIDVFLPVAAIVACWEAAPALNTDHSHSGDLRARAVRAGVVDDDPACVRAVPRYKAPL